MGAIFRAGRRTDALFRFGRMLQFRPGAKGTILELEMVRPSAVGMHLRVLRLRKEYKALHCRVEMLFCGLDEIFHYDFFCSLRLRRLIHLGLQIIPVISKSL